MQTAQDSIEEILKELSTFDGKYKKNYVDSAIQNKEKITPYLLNILETILKKPSIAVKDDNFYGHVYALMLLGSFKETRAHKLIINLFSFSENIIDALFGDILTEDLPMLLYNTCGGSFEEIKALILNKDICVYTRIAGMHALVYAVGEGVLPRREVLEFMAALFTGNEDERDSDFWSYAVSYICDLHPGELMEVIEKAFEDDLVCCGIIDYEDVEKDRERTVEGCIKRVKQNFKQRSLDDIHERMSWWTCFKQPADIFKYRPDCSQKKANTNKKKAKRKKAKDSRRKNRRR